LRRAKIQFSAFRSVHGAAIYLFELAAIVAAYLGLAECFRLLPAINSTATSLWPPTGLGLALLLLRGVRIWPAILAGSFSSGLATGRIPPVSGLDAIGTLLAALAGAYLIERWSDGWKTFATPRGVAKFALVSFAPTAIISSAATVASSSLATDTGLTQSIAAWTTSWLADAAGTLLVAPVIVLWAKPRFSKSTLPEAIPIFILGAAIAVVAYSPLIDSELLGDRFKALLTDRIVLAFLVVLPLMWASLRGSQRNAATTALIFVETAAWCLASGASSFRNADSNETLLLLLALALGTSVPSLVLSAAMAVRRDTEAQLLAVQKQLNRQLFETNQALQSVKRHFQLLIEGVADYAIFVLDTAGRVASWNSAAQQITGYTTDEIIGKHFAIFYRPDERRSGEPNRTLELAIQAKKHDVEGWRIRKNGTLFFVAGSVSSIRDDNGALIGFANIIRDATERREAQEKLVQAREQLAMAQKMEAIGKLTGGIAHDFNNLLMIIGGNAQTFKRLLDPKLPRAIEAIQAAAKRGESLTRQLLTFSRRQHLTPTVVDLCASVRNMRPMIESSLRGNIVYNENIGSNVRPVKVDLAELELAIVNLAVNARDAMPNGGTFTLSLANVAAANDRHNADDHFVAIEFNDTGTGIPPNLLPKIFDPFFTTKEVGKGTGLGLSQVYGFAHQAGGTVRADSKVGHGTTITIYLPTCSEKEIPSLEASTTDASYSQRPTVLVVDDSADVAEVTSSLFEHLGYATVYRDSAEAALKLLADGTKFDLVFSDIVMPGTIDGVGLASEIRARYPRLPVILTTGYSDAAQAAPQDLRILRKPFDTEALKGFIRDTVEMKSSLQ
jgi:PAS domain S-box-containing protein